MRVLLADDHDLVRDAIEALLVSTGDITVVAAKDLPGALSTVRAGPGFDAVILDFNMPGMGGLDGARLMVSATPAPVILMSGVARPQDVTTALSLGVRGFIPKTLAGKSLVSALRLVASGETYAPADYLRGDEAGADGGILTPRERDVLSQLRHGASNKEMARILGIAETTVKLHLRTLGEKVGARSRLEILIKAMERQWI